MHSVCCFLHCSREIFFGSSHFLYYFSPSFNKQVNIPPQATIDMADATVALSLPTAQQPQPQRGNRQRRGRGRGGRGGGGGGNDRTTNIHQNTPAPLQQPQQPQFASRTTGRRFGGQLTQSDTASDLSAQATTFIPASVAPTSSRPASRSAQSSSAATATPRNPPKVGQTLTRHVSRSAAPDLATRIHEDISHNIYECAICSNEVGRKSKVWSCDTCWTVFHIGCIKKWSKNEGSAVHRPREESGEENIGRQWRCPGCNLPKEEYPSAYTCWCEKELDPKVITGLPPHSCGQTCGRDRKFPRACPHPCDRLCHAGPCPPCTSTGPVQSCFCGKQSSTRRCLETNYEAGWSCGEVCGDIMPCGEHTCQRPCHEGVCGACTVQVPAKCYCGKVEKTISCNEQSDEKQSYDWLGVFNCGRTCDRPMDCGKHTCQQGCHPQEEQIPHCPRSPDVVSHCPCGKTSLAELSNAERTACTDPIPSCSKPCGKKLGCGHACTKNCHTGDCPPCLRKIPINCRCGRNTFETTCFGGYGQPEPPWCMRTCRVTLNCGRHECGERCCPGESLAAQRLAAKRGKKQSLFDAVPVRREEFEAEHICTRPCGRPLKCGNHNCTDLCHKGPCGSCKEAIFDDLTCNCGRTVLQAPLPCGTRPPTCNFPCQRRKTCGHPQVAHNCHSDEEECPKCPFLTEKPCLCGKKTLKNQPCWRADVLCGLVCGKPLKCGSHTCRKTCHRPGDCEDAHVHCQQECGKPKKTCGHPCEQPCHAPSTCKEEKACPFKVIITCDCQRKKEEVRCNARAGVPDPPSRQNSLKCDDECARLERNRKLAAALNIADDHIDDHIPYSNTSLNMYLENVAWCHEQEEIMRVFAADDDEKRYRFRPMRPRQRAFIHNLAEDFGFDCESLDPEPHRHILLFKTPKFVAAPMKTLAQAARIKRAQLNVATPVDRPSTPDTRANEVKLPEYNGLLLKKPRFALTEDELRPTIRSAAPSNDFAIVFLSSTDGIALLPQNEWSTQEQVQTFLETLHPTVSAAVSREGLAASAVLCQFDLTSPHAEPKILHEAGQPIAGVSAAGGWSQVAAKRSGAMAVPTIAPVGQRSSFTVLGSKLAEAKKRKEEEKAMEKKRKELLKQEVVEDWSAEVDREELETARSGQASPQLQDAPAATM